MAKFHDHQIAEIISTIEHGIRKQPCAGLLDHETVEALDVIHHALVFVHHPRGNELWREALWHRRLSVETRQALTQMLEYLTEAVARGETQAVSQICDCLQVFVGSNRGSEIEVNTDDMVG